MVLFSFYSKAHDKYFYLVGWGLTDVCNPPIPNNNLLETEVKIISNKKCKNASGSYRENEVKHRLAIYPNVRAVSDMIRFTTFLLFFVFLRIFALGQDSS